MTSSPTADVSPDPVPNQPEALHIGASPLPTPATGTLDLPVGVAPQVAADVVDWLAGWVNRERYGRELPTVADLHALADDLRTREA